MTCLSEKTLAICARHWRMDAARHPLADCCHGCPISAACRSGNGGGQETSETLDAWRQRCNAAAEAVAEP